MLELVASGCRTANTESSLQAASFKSALPHVWQTSRNFTWHQQISWPHEGSRQFAFKFNFDPEDTQSHPRPPFAQAWPVCMSEFSAAWSSSWYKAFSPSNSSTTQLGFPAKLPSFTQFFTLSVRLRDRRTSVVIEKECVQNSTFPTLSGLLWNLKDLLRLLRLVHALTQA